MTNTGTIILIKISQHKATNIIKVAIAIHQKIKSIKHNTYSLTLISILNLSISVTYHSEHYYYIQSTIYDSLTNTHF